MERWASWVKGWAEWELTGPAVEEFFNRCARAGVGFWDAREVERGRWVLRTSLRGVKKVRPIAGDGGWVLTLRRRGGLPGLVWGLRYRYALLAGMAVSLAAVGVLSQFIFTVRVTGNTRVPTGAILSQLRVQGVRPGAFGPGLDTRDICHRVILELPEISWMTVNLHGTVAEVLVREGQPRPELVEEEVPARIEARYSGIITHMEVTRGMALTGEGDRVQAGDILISSWVDFQEPEGYVGDMGGLLVRAAGRVEARVWHTLRAAVPLEGRAKAFTGREKSLWSMEFFGERVNFFGRGGIPYPEYDKIAVYYGGGWPVCLRREVCREYETVPRPVDRTAAEAMLKGALTDALRALAGRGEVLRTDFSVEERGGLLTVTLLAECSQDIARTVEEPIPGDSIPPALSS